MEYDDHLLLLTIRMLQIRTWCGVIVPGLAKYRPRSDHHVCTTQQTPTFSPARPSSEQFTEHFNASTKWFLVSFQTND